jgi:hypothetical protein
MFAAQPGGEFGYANQISNVLTPLGVTMATTAAPSAQSPSVTEQPPEPNAEQIQAGQVVDAFGPCLMKIPGVWGISPRGGPDGHFTMTVLVDTITPEIQSAVPSTPGGPSCDLSRAPTRVKRRASLF